MTKKKEKFIYTYETKIKEIRKEYYNNITTYSNSSDNYIYELLLKFFPTIFGIVIILTSGFSLLGLTTAIVLDIILSIASVIYIDKSEMNKNNKYLNEIRKQGYFTIDDYESKIKEYITGETGEYSIIYNKLIKKHNIDDKTDIIEDLYGNRYYLWSDDSKLYILNTKYNTKPEVETFKISDIRYFRLDRKKQITILKTSTEDKTYNKKTYDTLSKHLKNKQYENLKAYEPEENINDFERFMHKIKKEINKDIDYDQDKKNVYTANIIVFLIIMFGLTILLKFDFIENISLFIKIVIILEILFYNYNLTKFLQYKPLQRKTEKEYLSIINNKEECVDRFSELKVSLGVPNNADKIYTTDGNEYLIWVSNGYFHLFLNKIGFNIFYIAVKEKDTTYYKSDEKELTLKLKNKTYEFDIDSEKIIKKLLPNSNLNWINGLQK